MWGTVSVHVLKRYNGWTWRRDLQSNPTDVNRGTETNHSDINTSCLILCNVLTCPQVQLVSTQLQIGTYIKIANNSIQHGRNQIFNISNWTGCGRHGYSDPRYC